MFRDKLKRAALRLSKKVGSSATEAKSAPRTWSAPVDFDDSLVPELVDGNGDMPTPNDHRMYGRPYLSALISSGVGPVPIDLRHPSEVASGTLPNSLLIPGRQIENSLDILPSKDTPLVLFDADGGDLSNELATKLRELGWDGARMLQGGWAEWIENNEEHELPGTTGKFNIGATVRLDDNTSGWIQNCNQMGDSVNYDILVDDGCLETVRAGIAESELTA
jgi:rhodanese-related sulfurtransferase